MSENLKLKLQKFLVNLFAEGRYVDFWTINHVLPGILGAMLAELIGLSLEISFGVAFVLMIGWEIFEELFKIEECLTNRISDVVTGVMGFFTAYFFIIPWADDKLFFWFVILFLIYIAISIFGYFAYRMRSKFYI